MGHCQPQKNGGQWGARVEGKVGGELSSPYGVRDPLSPQECLGSPGDLTPAGASAREKGAPPPLRSPGERGQHRWRPCAQFHVKRAGRPCGDSGSSAL